MNNQGNIEWQNAWASVKELYNKVIQQGITPPNQKNIIQTVMLRLY